jgi:hypothetical protein
MTARQIREAKRIIEEHPDRRKIQDDTLYRGVRLDATLRD